MGDFEKDPKARVACETLITTGLALVAGEITTDCYVDIPKIVRETVCAIGYTRAKYGFDCDTCAVLTSIDDQSPDIALGVDKALEVKIGEMTDSELENIGAGDQGMMFGYASNETPEYLPMPVPWPKLSGVCHGSENWKIPYLLRRRARSQ